MTNKTFYRKTFSTLFDLSVEQVQEKKVKKISEMNMDPSKAVGNGSLASSSNLSSPKTYLANGGGPDKSFSCLSNDISFPPGGIPTLRLPQVTSHETSLIARCRRVYAHAHDYHINSISNNSDGETFISADDLRINLWNLEISNQSFNIVDVKPANMEDLTEVITSAEFHPTHCNTLAYSSSKGSIRLIDLRQSALCDSHAKLFEEPEAPGARSFFTEIIASISDIKFGKEGRYILSRDYMTLKLWDINMDSGPVQTFQVHEYLRPKLCDLYENDSIFDKFECCLSGDGSRVATGSYSNLFRVFGSATGSTEATTLEASKNPMRRQVQTPSRPSRSLSSSITRVVRRGAEIPGVDANGNCYDFTTKLLHLAWHPTENSIACAAANSLYILEAFGRMEYSHFPGRKCHSCALCFFVRLLGTYVLNNQVRIHGIKVSTEVGSGVKHFIQEWNIPVRYEAFWKEVGHFKNAIKSKEELNVENAGLVALFGVECFAWFCGGEIIGRGFTFTGYYV
ncbi:hypothetical protein C1H46_008697 [Malus baccata]|uniref:Serine/threonine-protein phosphatase 2A 55 kDa regulatory subunit B n=1 Tax=Malus baccata TaxID=106549 RepID=A0A540N3P1_MALBA|nr:hypothetical protein C1H46_008697 [Malus baccata]